VARNNQFSIFNNQWLGVVGWMIFAIGWPAGDGRAKLKVEIEQEEGGFLILDF
jgi:hypothetical protein